MNAPSGDGAPAKPRVGLLLDGSEGYGVQNSVRLLLERLNRDAVTIVGVFLGTGAVRDTLAQRCDEVYDLRTGCLLPFSVPGRGRYYVPNLVRRAVIFALALVRLTALIRRRRIDVLHANYYPLHFIAGLACRVRRKPCIWHWRGVTARRGVFTFIAALGWRYLATRIACISRFVAAAMPACVQAKTVVVYNGVPTREIREGQRPGELRRLVAVNADVPLVGIFGSLTQYKGHEYFLRAAAAVLQRCPDAHFVIVGGENAIQRTRYRREATLRRLADELGIAQRVHFAGSINNARLYMADCDVICMPTIPDRIAGEGFGLSMAEAMAAGVATVATTCGAPPEVIEDGVSGLLVPPRDSAALADAIAALLTDEPRRRAMGEAGRRRIVECFDIGRTARHMEALYLEVCRTEVRG